MYQPEAKEMKPLSSKKYKALMCDIDGTLIGYNYDSLPSKNVASTIRKADKKIFICLVTGRSFGSTKHILENMEINSGYAVINNGANVINLSNNNILYDKPIDNKAVKEIIEILNREKIGFYIKEKFDDIGMLKGYYKNYQIPEKTYMFYTEDIYQSTYIDRVIKELSKISSISIHKSKHKFPNKFGLNITHNKATKLHGVAFLIKILKLNKNEIIGIGDGYNDFPLLMACGLKVAMGNAVPDLKEIADYIAPSVDEDGVVDVLEKFVLRNKNSQ